MWDIAESLFMNPRTIRLLESIDLVYPIAIYFVKLSILLFYRRIFNTDRSLRLVIQITIIFLTAFYTAFSCIQIATVWQCAIWLTVNEYPICTNDYAIDVFQSGLNVLTSLFVFLLPLRNLLKLNLGKLQMIGFIVIYGFGLIDCLISVARVVLIVKLDQLDDLWNNGLISILR